MPFQGSRFIEISGRCSEWEVGQLEETNSTLCSLTEKKNLAYYACDLTTDLVLKNVKTS